MNTQYKSFRGLKLLANGDSKGRTVSGYFSVYNTIINEDSWVDCMLMPGIFAEAVASGVCNYLGGVAIKALYQHNNEHVLGSVKSGTLRLREDDKGLYAEVDLPNWAENIRESMDRGDIDEASIGFLPTAHEWIQGADKDLIKYLKADLKEVSIANFPKNPAARLQLNAELPVEIQPLKREIMRALNRYKENLDPTAEDKAVLEEHRSFIEPVLNAEMKAVLNHALAPKAVTSILMPEAVVRAYLDAYDLNL